MLLAHLDRLDLVGQRAQGRQALQGLAVPVDQAGLQERGLQEQRGRQDQVAPRVLVVQALRVRVGQAGHQDQLEQGELGRAGQVDLRALRGLQAQVVVGLRGRQGQQERAVQAGLLDLMGHQGQQEAGGWS